MAYVQIPNLPAAIAVTGSELIEAVQAGTSVKVSLRQISDSISAAQRFFFATREQFVSVASVATFAVGAVVDVLGYGYRYTGTGTAITDLPGWVADLDYYPQHNGAVGNGSTDDTAAINASVAASNLIVFPRTPFATTSQVTIPATVFVSARNGSRYASSSVNASGRILTKMTTAGAAIYRDGAVLQSLGGGVEFLSLTTHGSVSNVNLSGVALYGVQFNNVFNEIIDNMVVDHFNGAYAVYTSGQCNKLVFNNLRVTIVGTGNTVTASDYGGGVYLGASADCELYNPYIEAAGREGLNIASESKVIGGFIDLCRSGIFARGDQILVADTSLKFHRRNAIYIYDTTNFTLSECRLVSCNTEKAVYTSSAAAALFIDILNPGVRVTDCDFRNIQQWRGPALPPAISFGLNDGTTAIADGCDFGDVVDGGTHIVDPDGLWESGNFTLRNFTLTMGQSRAMLQTPVAFTAGLSVTNDTFTVTYGGDTYVANGQGHTFPFTTTSTFEYNPAYDQPGDSQNDWVKLQDPDTRGMYFPQSVITNIGNSSVRGTGTETAITISSNCSIDGTVEVSSCAVWLEAGSGAIGPKFIGTEAPSTALIVCTAPTSRYASLRGWKYPIAMENSGSGLAENADLIALPTTCSGRMSVSIGFTGACFVLSANIQWDGTTLTVTDKVCAPGPFDSAATFVNDSGQLAVRWSSATAFSGTASVEFDGIWTVTA